MNEANLANLLGALATSITDGVAEAVAPEAGDLPARTALSVLARYPGASIEELRAPLGLSHSGCVRLVDRLVEAGHVERQPASDGRAVALRLTRRGRAAASLIVEHRENALRRLVASLSPNEREQLGRIATKLLDHATPTPRAAGKTCRLCDYAACVECPFRARFADAG